MNSRGVQYGIRMPYTERPTLIRPATLAVVCGVLALAGYYAVKVADAVVEWDRISQAEHHDYP